VDFLEFPSDCAIERMMPAAAEKKREAGRIGLGVPAFALII
jgi:hypothetical protein